MLKKKKKKIVCNGDDTNRIAFWSLYYYTSKCFKPVQSCYRLDKESEGKNAIFLFGQKGEGVGVLIRGGGGACLKKYGNHN